MKHLLTLSIVLICVGTACDDPDAADYGTLKLTFAVTPASTSTAADGAIDLTVEGGKAPMTYTWSNGATTQDIEHLTMGGYAVTVQSDDGQSVTDSATVTMVEGTGSCTDYDGNTYATVQIGTQLWMAENFKGLHTAGGEALPGVHVYGNNESNAAIYGRLYTWEAAMSGSPSGWHLPSKAEWDILINAVGSNPVDKLLDGGSSGFNVKLGGNVRAGEYNYLGTFGAFWTATPTTDGSHACRRLFDPNLSYILDDNTPVDIGLSVRYIKD